MSVIAVSEERAVIGDVSIEKKTVIAATEDRFVYEVMHVSFSLSLVKIAVQLLLIILAVELFISPGYIILYIVALVTEHEVERHENKALLQCNLYSKVSKNRLQNSNFDLILCRVLGSVHSSCCVKDYRLLNSLRLYIEKSRSIQRWWKNQ